MVDTILAQPSAPTTLINNVTDTTPLLQTPFGIVTALALKTYLGLTTAIAGVAATVATLLSHAQPYHQPTGPIPTSSVLPYGVTLVTPNSNILDATFGTGGTIPDNATLDKVFYYRNNEGNLNDTCNYPNQGAASNWRAVYRNYPAFLSDGVTPDPANLHLMQSDHLDLIARTRVDSSYDNNRWEMGYLRAPVGVVPGSYAEIHARWASYSRDGISARWSWPVFWLFSIMQDFGTTNVYHGPNDMEIDCFDGFPPDNSVQGSNIFSAAPLYNDTSTFGTPLDTYSGGAPGYRPDGSNHSDTNGGGNVYPDEAHDPTADYHYYAIDWRDPNTIIWLYDGVIVRKRTVSYTNKKSDGTYVPLRIEASHQYVCEFNPLDQQAALDNNDATNPLRAAYSIKSIRVWNSTSTAVPGSGWVAPALDPAGTPVISGVQFPFVNTATADQHVRGSGTSADPTIITVTPSTDPKVSIIGGFDITNATGSWTIKMKQNTPLQDVFEGHLTLYSSTTSEFVDVVDEYSKGYSAWSGGIYSDTSGNLNYIGFGEHDFLGKYAPSFMRLTFDGTIYTMAGSRTGAVGTWTVFGTQAKSATSGNLNRFGYKMIVQDKQGYGQPVNYRLYGYEHTASTDPQAATGIA